MSKPNSALNIDMPTHHLQKQHSMVDISAMVQRLDHDVHASAAHAERDTHALTGSEGSELLREAVGTPLLSNGFFLFTANPFAMKHSIRYTKVEVDYGGDETRNFGSRVEYSSPTNLYEVMTVATVTGDVENCDEDAAIELPVIKSASNGADLAVLINQDLSLFDFVFSFRFIVTLHLAKYAEALTLSFLEQSRVLVILTLDGTLLFISVKLEKLVHKMEYVRDVGTAPSLRTHLVIKVKKIREKEFSRGASMSCARIDQMGVICVGVEDGSCTLITIDDYDQMLALLENDATADTSAMMISKTVVKSTRCDLGDSHIELVPPLATQFIFPHEKGRDTQVAMLGATERKYYITELGDEKDRDDCVHALACSDDRYLVEVRRDGWLTVWDMGTMVQLRQKRIVSEGEQVRGLTLLEEHNGVDSINAVLIVDNPFNGNTEVQVRRLNDAEVAYALAVESETVLLTFPPHEEFSILIVEPFGFNQRFDEAGVRIRVISESQPDARLDRLLNRMKFDDAELFAKQFKLDIQVFHMLNIENEFITPSFQRLVQNNLIDYFIVSHFKGNKVHKSRVNCILSELSSNGVVLRHKFEAFLKYLDLITDDNWVTEICIAGVTLCYSFDYISELLRYVEKRDISDEETLERLARLRYNLTSYRLLYGPSVGYASFDMDSPWTKFIEDNVWKEVFMEFCNQGYFSEALIVWQRYLREMREWMRDEVDTFKQIVDVIQEVIPVDIKKLWAALELMELEVLPMALTKDPVSTISVCVTWLKSIAAVLELQQPSEFPSNALKALSIVQRVMHSLIHHAIAPAETVSYFLLIGVDSLPNAASCRAYRQLEISGYRTEVAYVLMMTRADSEDVNDFMGQLNVYVKNLKEMENLKNVYKYPMTYARYTVETVESICDLMLERVRSVHLIKNSIECFVKPYTREHHLDFNQTLYNYIIKVSSKCSMSIGETNPWDERCLAIAEMISSKWLRCEAIIGIARRACPPWSAPLQKAVQAMMDDPHLDSTLHAKLRYECDFAALAQMMMRYTIPVATLKCCMRTKQMFLATIDFIFGETEVQPCHLERLKDVLKGTNELRLRQIGAATCILERFAEKSKKNMELLMKLRAVRDMQVRYSLAVSLVMLEDDEQKIALLKDLVNKQWTTNASQMWLETRSLCSKLFIDLEEAFDVLLRGAVERNDALLAVQFAEKALSDVCGPSTRFLDLVVECCRFALSTMPRMGEETDVEPLIFLHYTLRRVVSSLVFVASPDYSQLHLALNIATFVEIFDELLTQCFADEMQPVVSEEIAAGRVEGLHPDSLSEGVRRTNIMWGMDSLTGIYNFKSDGQIYDRIGAVRSISRIAGSVFPEQLLLCLIPRLRTYSELLCNSHEQEACFDENDDRYSSNFEQSVGALCERIIVSSPADLWLASTALLHLSVNTVKETLVRLRKWSHSRRSPEALIAFVRICQFVVLCREPNDHDTLNMLEQSYVRNIWAKRLAAVGARLPYQITPAAVVKEFVNARLTVSFIVDVASVKQACWQHNIHLASCRRAGEVVVLPAFKTVEGVLVDCSFCKDFMFDSMEAILLYALQMLLKCAKQDDAKAHHEMIQLSESAFGMLEVTENIFMRLYDCLMSLCPYDYEAISLLIKLMHKHALVDNEEHTLILKRASIALQFLQKATRRAVRTTNELRWYHERKMFIERRQCGEETTLSLLAEGGVESTLSDVVVKDVCETHEPLDIRLPSRACERLPFHPFLFEDNKDIQGTLLPIIYAELNVYNVEVWVELVRRMPRLAISKSDLLAKAILLLVSSRTESGVSLEDAEVEKVRALVFSAGNRVGVAKALMAGIRQLPLCESETKLQLLTIGVDVANMWLGPSGAQLTKPVQEGEKKMISNFAVYLSSSDKRYRTELLLRKVDLLKTETADLLRSPTELIMYIYSNAIDWYDPRDKKTKLDLINELMTLHELDRAALQDELVDRWLVSDKDAGIAVDPNDRNAMSYETKVRCMCCLMRLLNAEQFDTILGYSATGAWYGNCILNFSQQADK
ncbi:unnamed protein product [Toxocara canis]|uniref:DNA damage-binding protein 1 n=1 Tax=Toxocara canis TaxID=6265 RepID=A0A183UNB4_TOXCA|nr:unnamed protein product [Toxocara canis]